MSCPYCQSTSPPSPVKFYFPTFIILGMWGSKIFHVAKCPQCGKNYDGKNGTMLGKKVLLTYCFVAMALLSVLWLGLKGYL